MALRDASTRDSEARARFASARRRRSASSHAPAFGRSCDDDQRWPIGLETIAVPVQGLVGHEQLVERAKDCGSRSVGCLEMNQRGVRAVIAREVTRADLPLVVVIA